LNGGSNILSLGMSSSKKILDFFDEDVPKSLTVSLYQIIWAHVTGSALNGILIRNK